MELGRAIAILCDSGVDFIVIWGVAAVLHGSAVVTFDLDILYSRADKNIRRLAEALAAFHPRPRGFPPGLPFVWDEATLRNSMVLTLTTDLGDVDLLAEVAGVGSYEAAKPRSITIKAYGHGFLILDLRDLLRAKRAAGRDKDRIGIPELESLLEAQDPEDRTEDGE